MTHDDQSLSLAKDCGLAFIVAHDEDTSELRASLQLEGLQVREVRGPYLPSQAGFSSAMKCLVNHANCWREAASREGPSIIVEADFIPVVGFGSLPIPAPARHAGRCLPYLYACGPEIWDIEEDVARGHAGATVAYVVWPRVAEELLVFHDAQIAVNPAGEYRAFDTELGYWLKERGMQSFIPLRQYGEHGGAPNPEHGASGTPRSHRADALLGPLHFLPAYAQGDVWRMRIVRSWARAWGWMRLLSGRLVPPRDLLRNRCRSAIFALRRLS